MALKKQSQVQNHSAEEIYAGESDKNSDRLSMISAKTSIFHPHGHIGNSKLEQNLDTFGDIVYQTCPNIFEVKQYQARSKAKKSRSQREMEALRMQ